MVSIRNHLIQNQKQSKNMATTNLDEFINNTLFTVDNQAQAKARGTTAPALPRQGSISLSELFGSDSDNDSPIPNTNGASPPEVPKFERLSLEEFLFRAGILKESDLPQAPPPPQQHPCLNRGNLAVGPNYVARPVMGGGGVNTRVDNQGPAVERVYEGVGAPVLSPVSSDGVGPVQVVDTRSRKIRKTGGREKVVERQLQPRILETPAERQQPSKLEMLIERNKRRMIRNREAAARSRATKLAYTTELEVDKKQLAKENECLKQRVAELEKKLSEQVKYSDHSYTNIAVRKRN